MQPLYSIRRKIPGVFEPTLMNPKIFQYGLFIDFNNSKKFSATGSLPLVTHFPRLAGTLAFAFLPAVTGRPKPRLCFGSKPNRILNFCALLSVYSRPLLPSGSKGLASHPFAEQGKANPCLPPTNKVGSFALPPARVGSFAFPCSAKGRESNLAKPSVATKLAKPTVAKGKHNKFKFLYNVKPLSEIRSEIRDHQSDRLAALKKVIKMRVKDDFLYQLKNSKEKNLLNSLSIKPGFLKTSHIPEVNNFSLILERNGYHPFGAMAWFPLLTSSQRSWESKGKRSKTVGSQPRKTLLPTKLEKLDKKQPLFTAVSFPTYGNDKAKHENKKRKFVNKRNATIAFMAKLSKQEKKLSSLVYSERNLNSLVNVDVNFGTGFGRAFMKAKDFFTSFTSGQRVNALLSLREAEVSFGPLKAPSVGPQSKGFELKTKKTPFLTLRIPEENKSILCYWLIPFLGFVITIPNCRVGDIKTLCVFERKYEGFTTIGFDSLAKQTFAFPPGCEANPTSTAKRKGGGKQGNGPKTVGSPPTLAKPTGGKGKSPVFFQARVGRFATGGNHPVSFASFDSLPGGFASHPGGFASLAKPPVAGQRVGSEATTKLVKPLVDTKLGSFYFPWDKVNSSFSEKNAELFSFPVKKRGFFIDLTPLQRAKPNVFVPGQKSFSDFLLKPKKWFWFNPFNSNFSPIPRTMCVIKKSNTNFPKKIFIPSRLIGNSNLTSILAFPEGKQTASITSGNEAVCFPSGKARIEAETEVKFFSSLEENPLLTFQKASFFLENIFKASIFHKAELALNPMNIQKIKIALSRGFFPSVISGTGGFATSGREETREETLPSQLKEGKNILAPRRHTNSAALRPNQARDSFYRNSTTLNDFLFGKKKDLILIDLLSSLKNNLEKIYTWKKLKFFLAPLVRKDQITVGFAPWSSGKGATSWPNKKNDFGLLLTGGSNKATRQLDDVTKVKKIGPIVKITHPILTYFGLEKNTFTIPTAEKPRVGSEATTKLYFVPKPSVATKLGSVCFPLLCCEATGGTASKGKRIKAVLSFPLRGSKRKGAEWNDFVPKGALIRLGTKQNKKSSLTRFVGLRKKNSNFFNKKNSTQKGFIKKSSLRDFIATEESYLAFGTKQKNPFRFATGGNRSGKDSKPLPQVGKQTLPTNPNERDRSKGWVFNKTDFLLKKNKQLLPKKKASVENLFRNYLSSTLHKKKSLPDLLTSSLPLRGRSWVTSSQLLPRSGRESKGNANGLFFQGKLKKKSSKVNNDLIQSVLKKIKERLHSKFIKNNLLSFEPKQTRGPNQTFGPQQTFGPKETVGSQKTLLTSSLPLRGRSWVTSGSNRFSTFPTLLVGSEANPEGREGNAVRAEQIQHDPSMETGGRKKEKPLISKTRNNFSPIQLLISKKLFKKRFESFSSLSLSTGGKEKLTGGKLTITDIQKTFYLNKVRVNATQQKKHRAKKQRLETRRQKKRKRFYPRPLWLRCRVYQKFLKKRFFTSFDYLPFASEANPPVSFASKANPTSTAKRKGGGKQGFASLANLSPLAKLESPKIQRKELCRNSNFYKVSNSVITDLYRAQSKSYWLRTNLKPYLRRIKNYLNQLKAKQTFSLFSFPGEKATWFPSLQSGLLFFGPKETFGPKQNLRFSSEANPLLPEVSKGREETLLTCGSLPEVNNKLFPCLLSQRSWEEVSKPSGLASHPFASEAKPTSLVGGKQGFASHPFATGGKQGNAKVRFASAAPNSNLRKWKKIRKIAEYNKIASKRIQKIIENIRENLNANGTNKIRSLNLGHKKLTSFLTEFKPESFVGTSSTQQTNQSQSKLKQKTLLKDIFIILYNNGFLHSRFPTVGNSGNFSLLADFAPLRFSVFNLKGCKGVSHDSFSSLSCFSKKNRNKRLIKLLAKQTLAFLPEVSKQRDSRKPIFIFKGLASQPEVDNAYLNWALDKTNIFSFQEMNKRNIAWSNQKLRNQSKNNKTKFLQKQLSKNFDALISGDFTINKVLQTFISEKSQIQAGMDNKNQSDLYPTFGKSGIGLPKRWNFRISQKIRKKEEKLNFLGNSKKSQNLFFLKDQILSLSNIKTIHALRKQWNLRDKNLFITSDRLASFVAETTRTGGFASHPFAEQGLASLAKPPVAKGRVGRFAFPLLPAVKKGRESKLYFVPKPSVATKIENRSGLRTGAKPSKMVRKSSSKIRLQETKIFANNFTLEKKKKIAMKHLKKNFWWSELNIKKPFKQIFRNILPFKEASAGGAKKSFLMSGFATFRTSTAKRKGVTSGSPPTLATGGILTPLSKLSEVTKLGNIFTLLFHFCALLSLISIPQIRCLWKFHFILIFKLSNSYVHIINSLYNFLTKKIKGLLYFSSNGLSALRGSVYFPANPKFYSVYYQPTEVGLLSFPLLERKILSQGKFNFFVETFKTIKIGNTILKSVLFRKGSDILLSRKKPISPIPTLATGGFASHPFASEAKPTSLVGGKQGFASHPFATGGKQGNANQTKTTKKKSFFSLVRFVKKIPSFFKKESLFKRYLNKKLIEQRSSILSFDSLSFTDQGFASHPFASEAKPTSLVGGKQGFASHPFATGGKQGFASLAKPPVNEANQRVSSLASLPYKSLILTALLLEISSLTCLVCSATKVTLKAFVKSKLLAYKTMLSFSDFFEYCLRGIYVFFEKPGEWTLDWIAYVFLVEWSSDFITILPENIDFSLWSSFSKFSRGSKGGLIFTSELQRRLLSATETFIETLSQPDTDLILRQKKGTLFWEIWAEFLIKVADKSNINIPSLSSLKEEQNVLMEKVLYSSDNASSTDLVFRPKVGKEIAFFPKRNASITEGKRLTSASEANRREGSGARVSFASRRECKAFNLRVGWLGSEVSPSGANRREESKATKLAKKINASFGTKHTRDQGFASHPFASEAKPTSLGGGKQGNENKSEVETYLPLEKVRPLNNGKDFLTSEKEIPILKKWITFDDFINTSSIYFDAASKGHLALFEKNRPKVTQPFSYLSYLLRKQREYKSSFFSLEGQLTFIKKTYTRKNENVPLNKIGQEKSARWSTNQFLTYQGKDTELFIDLHPPLSFSHLSAIKYYNQIKQPLGTLVCQIYSGIFYKQMAKNILVTGAAGSEKSLLIQALAGETELKIITDNANRYALVTRGLAVGIKLLRDVFDAIALHTPCIFLMEDIHAIGERRPLLISDDENSKATETSFVNSESLEVHEKNQVIYQLSRHGISHYKKPYKGDFSLLMPTNHFSFDLFLGVNPPRARGALTKGSGVTIGRPLEISNIDGEGGSNNSNFLAKGDKKRKFASHLQLPSEQLFAPPATSPFTVLLLKEQKKLKPRKLVKELPWTGFPSEQLALLPKVTYSIRVKVAVLADLAISNMSAKLDMITDLLVIIDSVRSNRGFVVFATTHLPYILDPALRRPGRLDETISIPLISNIWSRWEILKSNLAFFFQPTNNRSNFLSDLSFAYGATIDLLDYTYLLSASSGSNYGQWPSLAPSGCSATEGRERKTISDMGSSLNILVKGISKFSNKKTLFNEKSFSNLLNPYLRYRSKINNIQEIQSNFLTDSFNYFTGDINALQILWKPVAFPPGRESKLAKQTFSTGDFAFPCFATEGKQAKGRESKLPTSLGGGKPGKKANGFYSLRSGKSRKKTPALKLFEELTFIKNFIRKKCTNFKAITYFQIGKKLINTKICYNLTSYSPISFLNSTFLNSNNTSLAVLQEGGFNVENEFQFLTLYSEIASLSKKGSKRFASHPFASEAKPTSLFAFPCSAKGRESKLGDKQGDESGFSLKTSKVNLLKQQVICLFSGKISESFAFSNNKEKVGYLGKKNKKVLQPSLGLLSILGIDQSWRAGTSLIFALIQKRYLYNKNMVIPRLLNFVDSCGNIGEPPSPPSSTILIPAKRYENYSRMHSAFEKKANLSIHEKIKLHQQQRFMKRLYRLPVKNSFRSELIENALTVFSNASLILNPIERSWRTSATNKTTAINWYYRNRILNRHRNYLNNQWWNAQLAEHNSETVFLSDVDWRVTFVDSLGDILIDFPDADQIYSPRRRRWMLTSSSWNFWYSFEKILTQEIYEHFIFESFIQSYNFLDKNREILDFSAFKFIKSGFLKENHLINSFKRF